MRTLRDYSEGAMAAEHPAGHSRLHKHKKVMQEIMMTAKADTRGWYYSAVYLAAHRVEDFTFPILFLSLFQQERMSFGHTLSDPKNTGSLATTTVTIASAMCMLHMLQRGTATDVKRINYLHRAPRFEWLSGLSMHSQRCCGSQHCAYLRNDSTPRSKETTGCQTTR